LACPFLFLGLTFSDVYIVTEWPFLPPAIPHRTMAPSVDYFQHRAEGLGMSIAFLIIATLSTVLRFLARSKIKVKPQLDDWLMIPALSAFYVFVASIIWSKLSDIIQSS
jgi:hypothetical protein